MRTGIPIEQRTKPHIFRADGKWRMWCGTWMPWWIIIPAYRHIRKLEGLPYE